MRSLMAAAAALMGQAALAESAPDAAFRASPRDVARGAALVAKAVQALGGAAALQNVQRMEILDRTSSPSSGELAVDTRTLLTADQRYRRELRVEGRTMATLLNARGGFLVTEDSQTRQVLAVPDAAAAALRTAVRLEPFLLLGRRHPLEAAKVGTSVVGESSVEVVAAGKGDEASTLYVDPATGQVRRIIAGAPLDDNPAMTIDYSDYRPIGGGLNYPFLSRVASALGVAIRHVQKVVVNGPADDSLFEEPSSYASPLPSPPPSTLPPHEPRP
jgi:hypothetical protein